MDIEEVFIKQEDVDTFERDYVENAEKIFAFQCLFCYEKFEVGAYLEKRLIDHYYSQHEQFVEKMINIMSTKEISNTNYQETEILEDTKEAKIELIDYFKDDNKVHNMDPENTDNKTKIYSCEEGTSSKISIVDLNKVKKSKNVFISEYKCKFCDKYLATEINLNKHQDNHKELYIRCKICQEQFYLVSKCIEHLKRDHEPVVNVDELIIDENAEFPNDFKCKFCFKVSKTRIKHLDHELVHSEPTFACNICGEKLRTFPLKKRHLKDHHGIKDKEPRPDTMKNKTKQNKDLLPHCKICYITFSTFSRLEKHEMTHKIPSIKCKLCEALFDIKPKCRKHLASIHDILETDNQNQFIIDGRREIRGNIGTAKSLSICDICGKVCNSESNLKSHLNVHKTNRTRYECDLCQLKYLHKEHLLQHIQKFHLLQRNYKCDLCGKTYREGVGLRYHKKSAHSDERPFKCEFCDSTFKAKQHLVGHTSTVHYGQKKFKCKPCGKAFTKGSGRKKHNKSVHGIFLTRIPFNDEEPADDAILE